MGLRLYVIKGNWRLFACYGSPESCKTLDELAFFSALSSGREEALLAGCFP